MAGWIDIMYCSKEDISKKIDWVHREEEDDTKR